MEIWKDIPNYEGLYMVSNLGRVKKIQSGKILKQSKASKGYPVVALRKDDVVKQNYIHRLLAQLFIPNPENKPCINHKNGDMADYSLDNLEWCTYKENIHHAWNTGLSKLPPNTGKGKITEDVKMKILELRSKGLFQKQIGELVGVHQSEISRMLSNKKKQKKRITKSPLK